MVAGVFQMSMITERGPQRPAAGDLVVVSAWVVSAQVPGAERVETDRDPATAVWSPAARITRIHQES